MSRTSALTTVLLMLTANAAAETRWFVVAEISPFHGDSYLLPLRDPQTIEQARTLLAEGPGGSVGSIASVKIAAGSDGFNRNVNAAGSPSWSWYVTEFSGFADITIELCDGWPSFVEQDVRGFIANTNGRVCFWSYTIVAELAEAPLFRIDADVEGAWFDPATPGQGILLDVLPNGEDIFLAWFTYVQQSLSGDTDEQRWFTAQGRFADNILNAEITLTTGGSFDNDTPVRNQPAGTLSLRFANCNHANVEYQLDGGPTGDIALTRLVARSGCGQTRGD